MLKIIAHLNMNYVGYDVYGAFVYDEGTSEDRINEELYWAAVEHAQMYFPFYSDEDFDNMDEKELAEVEESPYLTPDQVYASWELYNPEKHDMYRSGGGSFEEDFKQLM